MARVQTFVKKLENPAYMGLKMSVSVEYSGNNCVVTVIPYLLHHRISKGSQSNSVTCTINGYTSSQGNREISSQSSADQETQLTNTAFTRTIAGGTNLSISVDLSFKLNASLPPYYVGTMSVSGSVNANKPTASLTIGTIKSDSLTFTITSSTPCKTFYWKRGSGDWQTETVATATNTFNKTISSLSGGNTYTIYAKCKDDDLNAESSEVSKSVTTPFDFKIISVSDCNIYAQHPNFNVRFMINQVNDRQYGLQIKNGNTILASFYPITVVKGENTLTLALSSTQRTAVLSLMTEVLEKTFTVYLYSVASGIDYSTTHDMKMMMYGSDVAPDFPPYATISALVDDVTYGITGSQDPHDGIISNLTDIWIDGVTAIVKETEVDRYYVQIGDYEASGSTTRFETPTLSIGGTQTTITFGVVDKRGLRRELHIYNCPIIQFNPITLDSIHIYRNNLYDTTIKYEISGRLTMLNGTNSVQSFVVERNDGLSHNLTASVSQNGKITCVGTMDWSDDWAAAKDTQYTFTVTITDAYDTTYTADVIVPIGIPLVHMESNQVMVNGQLNWKNAVAIDGAYMWLTIGNKKYKLPLIEVQDV